MLRKTISSLILLFISFQGVLILIDPEHRNRLYSTITAIHESEQPLLQSIAERGRLLVAIALIPTCLYPQSWVIPKFLSLIAYVVYIGILYNLYLFHGFEDVAHFLFQVLVLVEFILMVVDDLLVFDEEERVSRNKDRNQGQKSILNGIGQQVFVGQNFKSQQKNQAQKAK